MTVLPTKYAPTYLTSPDTPFDSLFHRGKLGGPGPGGGGISLYKYRVSLH